MRWTLDELSSVDEDVYEVLRDETIKELTRRSP